MATATRHLWQKLRDPSWGFPLKPALVGDLLIVALPDDLGVQIRGAGAPVLLRGQSAAAAIGSLTEQLDGSRTVEEIVSHCGSSVGEPTLLEALWLLHRHRLLRSGPPPGDAAAGAADLVLNRQRMFWGRYLGGCTAPQRRLSDTRIAIMGTGLFGSVSYDLLTRSGANVVAVIAWDDPDLLPRAVAHAPSLPERAIVLESTGPDPAIGVVRPILEGTDILITATRNGPATLFSALNRACLAAGIPWLRGDDVAGRFDLGPLVVPFESACYECMALREASSHPFAIEEHLVQEALGEARAAGSSRPLGEDVAAATLGASLLATEASRFIFGTRPPQLVNALIAADPVDGTIRRNELRRVPRCPACHPNRSPAGETDERHPARP